MGPRKMPQHQLNITSKPNLMMRMYRGDDRSAQADALKKSFLKVYLMRGQFLR